MDISLIATLAEALGAICLAIVIFWHVVPTRRSPAGQGDRACAPARYVVVAGRSHGATTSDRWRNRRWCAIWSRARTWRSSDDGGLLLGEEDFTVEAGKDSRRRIRSASQSRGRRGPAGSTAGVGDPDRCCRTARLMVRDRGHEPAHALRRRGWLARPIASRLGGERRGSAALAPARVSPLGVFFLGVAGIEVEEALAGEIVGHRLAHGPQLLHEPGILADQALPLLLGHLEDVGIEPTAPAPRRGSSRAA